MPLDSVEEWRARIGSSYCALEIWQPVKLRGSRHHVGTFSRCKRSTCYLPLNNGYLSQNFIHVTTLIVLWSKLNLLHRKHWIVDKIKANGCEIATAFVSCVIYFAYIRALLLLGGDIETNPGPAIPDPEYRSMQTKLCTNPGATGFVLIVTCSYRYRNSNMIPLHSTYADGSSMKEAFEKLSFTTYWRHDARKVDFVQLIKEIMNVNPTPNIQCIVFVFSGHGNVEDTILSEDGQVIKVKEDLVDKLIMSENIAFLPKLFFIDACRCSGKATNGYSAKSSPVLLRQSGLYHEPLPKVAILVGNYLLAYSTTDTAHMRPSDCHHGNEGSVWIQMLAKELTSHESVQNITARLRYKMMTISAETRQKPFTIDRLNCGPLYLTSGKQSETGLDEFCQRHIKGFALIITNDYVPSKKPLVETHKDGQAMEKALKSLNFETRWERNVSKAEHLKLIETLIVRASGYDCIAFVFSGHGNTNYVLQSQDKMLISYAECLGRIINSDQISHVPKLFIIDACLGKGKIEANEYMYRDHSKFQPTHLDYFTGIKFRSDENNFLLAYSTIPSKVSWNRKGVGGDWIQSLALNLSLKLDGKPRSVQDILAIVRQEMIDKIGQKQCSLQQAETTDRLDCGPLFLTPTYCCKPRGLTVVFTNDYKTTPCLEAMPDIHHDGLILKPVFEYLGFITWWKQCLTRIQLLETMDAIIHYPHPDIAGYESIVFVFSGYCDEGYTLYAQDGEQIDLHTEIIEKLVSNPKLRNVQVIFLIGSCHVNLKEVETFERNGLELVVPNGNYFMAYITLDQAHWKSRSEDRNPVFPKHHSGSCWMQLLSSSLYQHWSPTELKSIYEVVASVKKQLYDNVAITAPNSIHSAMVYLLFDNLLESYKGEYVNGPGMIQNTLPELLESLKSFSSSLRLTVDQTLQTLEKMKRDCDSNARSRIMTACCDVRTMSKVGLEFVDKVDDFFWLGKHSHRIDKIRNAICRNDLILFDQFMKELRSKLYEAECKRQELVSVCTQASQSCLNAEKYCQQRVDKARHARQSIEHHSEIKKTVFSELVAVVSLVSAPLTLGVSLGVGYLVNKYGRSRISKKTAGEVARYDGVEKAFRDICTDFQSVRLSSKDISDKTGEVHHHLKDITMEMDEVETNIYHNDPGKLLVDLRLLQENFANF